MTWKLVLPEAITLGGTRRLLNLPDRRAMIGR